MDLEEEVWILKEELGKTSFSSSKTFKNTCLFSGISRDDSVNA